MTDNDKAAALKAEAATRIRRDLLDLAYGRRPGGRTPRPVRK